MRIARVLPLLLLTGAAPAHRYTLDSSRSDISAKVAFVGIASKTARFPVASGGMTLDPAHPGAVDLDITLEAAALTAPDPVTLSRLKGPAFFDVARYPTLMFRGDAMRMTGDRTAMVTRRITARGVTRPATLAIRFASPPHRDQGRTPLTIKASTTIERTDSGMIAYRPIVGRKFTISAR